MGVRRYLGAGDCVFFGYGVCCNGHGCDMNERIRQSSSGCEGFHTHGMLSVVVHML